MKKKFYAIANGSKPQIYTSLAEFQSAAKRIKPPICKGFSNLEDAEKFIKEFEFLQNPPTGPFYVVYTGTKPGIYLSEEEYEKNITGVAGAEGLKLNSLEKVYFYVKAMDGKYSSTSGIEMFRCYTELLKANNVIAPTVKIKPAESHSDNLIPGPFYVVYKGKKPGIYSSLKDYNINITGFSKATGKKVENLQLAKAYLDLKDKEYSSKVGARLYKEFTSKKTENSPIGSNQIADAQGVNPTSSSDNRGTVKAENAVSLFKQSDKKMDVSDGQVANNEPPCGVYAITGDCFKLSRNDNYWRKLASLNKGVMFAFSDGSGSNRYKSGSGCISYYGENVFVEKNIHFPRTIQETAHLSEVNAAILAMMKAYSIGARVLILFVDRADVIKGMTSITPFPNKESRKLWEFAKMYGKCMTILVCKVPAHKDCVMNNTVDAIASLSCKNLPV